MKLYKTYVFKDKDPVIDRVRTILQDEGVSYYKAGEQSGVSGSTIHAWMEGDTKRPQYSTIAAVVTALGYEIDFKKSNVVNIKRRRIA